MLVVERSGPTMLARIGVMKVRHRHEVRQFNSDATASNFQLEAKNNKKLARNRNCKTPELGTRDQ